MEGKSLAGQADLKDWETHGGGAYGWGFQRLTCQAGDTAMASREKEAFSGPRWTR